MELRESRRMERRKRPDADMRLLAGLAEEADAAPSMTFGQLELRGVRGARVAPKVELVVFCVAKLSSSAVASSAQRKSRIAGGSASSEAAEHM